jgi:hypothetical protein
MTYDHNDLEQLFYNLPAKIEDVIHEICWSPNLFKLSQSFLDIICRSIRVYHIKLTNKGLYKKSISFDRITIKLRIISICPVALSCYTSPTSSRVPREDEASI